jgi:putative ubiquitin-RnfH superfamily antitoxin RatB of RatAB toxin-antitoxin module
MRRTTIRCADASAGIEVEVSAAGEGWTVSRRFELACGANVAHALAAAAAEPEFAALLPAAAVGIFGRVVPLDEVLADGDRVELYRPLAADPKSARRARARIEARRR